MTVKPEPYLVDDENPELTDDQIKAMHPASEVLPPALYKKLVEGYEAHRAAREAVTLYPAPEVVARLRAEGPSWEDRVAAMLREAVGLQLSERQLFFRPDRDVTLTMLINESAPCNNTIITNYKSGKL